MTQLLRQAFTQTLTVLTRQRPYADLDLGQCFTVPCDTGFGHIWIGFPIWVKTQAGGVSIDGGQSRSFKDLDTVLIVTYGTIQKPE
jgi:hypothetical protein